MKILFAASEAVPYVKTGASVSVASALPKALAAYPNTEVCVFLPYYKSIQETPDFKVEKVLQFNTPLSWRNIQTTLYRASTQQKNLHYYFIDSPYHFYRDNMYGYEDDPERFAFFSKAALECLQYLNWHPDIIHVNDWQTAAIPIFLKAFYQGVDSYRSIRTLFSIHTPGCQGKVDKSFPYDVMGLPWDWNGTLELEGCVNLMKGSILTSDRISAPSLEKQPTEGIHRILNSYGYKCTGISIGIDPEAFDPANDPLIYSRFTADKPGNKLDNRRFLQEKLGLPLLDEIPLVVMTDEFADSNEADLIRTTLNDILTEDLQLIIFDTGKEQHHETFIRYASAYPQKVSVITVYDHVPTCQVYAGSDMILVPSEKESCGITQLIAMRYGAVPILRNAGDSFADAIRRTLLLYQNKDCWNDLRRRAMTHDCRWDQFVQEHWQLCLSLV